MTYTAIPNGDVDADSPITTGLMTKLRDNPIAIAAGDTGAPQNQTAAIADNAITAAKIAADAVGQSEIAADSVGQSEIKTTFQAIENIGDFYFTAAGGMYVIGATCDGSTSVTALHQGGNTNFDLLARWRWRGQSSRGTLNQYYINASPPYDLGDGAIPLFIYAIMDNASGDLVGYSASVDPVWAYNGPTVIKPYRHEGEKAFQRVKDMSGYALTLAECKAQGAAKVKEYAEAYAAADEIDEEITQAAKNADMDTVKHPFEGNDLTGQTVVMLDPVSPVLETLLEMRSHGNGADAGEIINNYLNFGNTGLPRGGPSGLMIVSVNWKKS